ncbi:hypothetical protein KDH_35870 [Dictyobacter sp. S3.2.2.5]|uniref:Uncharacterized protein n=1 Tax=Dictyobacter halimunensis TaxID=3026934 RepID=A0ABQ6FR52_9CHLR|nr:hypothetical protein KDH_35870 [Dictyobacter sp. S3.2.2.5]
MFTEIDIREATVSQTFQDAVIPQLCPNKLHHKYGTVQWSTKDAKYVVLFVYSVEVVSPAPPFGRRIRGHLIF